MLVDEPTVFVVEDDEDMRQSLERLLGSEGLRVESYAGPQAYLDAFDPARPGCLLLDLRLPGMSGLEMIERLHGFEPRPPFIVITGHGDVPTAVHAMHDGALDFLEKPVSRQSLLERVHEALATDAQARARHAARRQVEDRLNRLTPREREVLDLMLTGTSTKSIAERLKISTKTVEIHRANVRQKMGVSSVAQLVLMVTKRIVPSPDVDEQEA
ncbi:MAG: response regulator transcription factor [Pirellulales bacterium]|nr:response regulator transcription factor [Pirellulales bacterium]